MFGDFRKTVKKGEKYIFVENGKPEYVVMHYDDYTELVSLRDMSGDIPNEALAKEAGDEGFNAETILSGPNLPEDISKIRLEDLPL